MMMRRNDVKHTNKVGRIAITVRPKITRKACAVSAAGVLSAVAARVAPPRAGAAAGDGAVLTAPCDAIRPLDGLEAGELIVGENSAGVCAWPIPQTMATHKTPT